MSKERMLAYLEKLYGITKDIEDKLQNEKVGDKEVKKMTGYSGSVVKTKI